MTLCGIPWRPITSAQWKGHFHLSGKGKNDRERKQQDRDLARELFPDASPFLERVMDHAIADAILIAKYGSVRWRIDEADRVQNPRLL